MSPLSNPPVLLMDERHSVDSSDIWRAAIRRGWRTERVNQRSITTIGDHGRPVYYGNTLHAAMLGDLLPVDLLPIFPEFLPALAPYTKRRMDLIRYETLGQPFTERIFAKPIRDKWFVARVYQQGQVIDGQSHPEDGIYLSEPVRFIDEVRCFVLNGEILTASYYIRKGEIHDTIADGSHAMFNFDAGILDTPIPTMVRKIVEQTDEYDYDHKLPPGVVMDFALTEDRGWVLIEFNEAWCSGVYYCDYDKCLTVIEASQIPKRVL